MCNIYICVCVCMCMYAFVCAQLLRNVQLFAIPYTVACQAPLSMGFVRQKYWDGLPFPSPSDFSDPGIKPASPASAGRFFYIKPIYIYIYM